MKTALLVFLGVLLVASKSRLVNDQAFINSINAANGITWVAGANERFDGMTLDEMKHLCGTHRSETKLPRKFVRPAAPIPASFDARDNWPQCPSIARIYDQGHCGSCWAMGAFQTLQDRFCIASNGKQQPELAPQDLVSCDPNDNGCEGGQSESAWDYLQHNGVVLETCSPYLMGTCHHPGCSEWPTPKCNHTCVDGESWKTSKHFASSGYSLGSVAQIQAEIMKNGPVEASFQVFADFGNYQSGVYHHVKGGSQGFHAVKLVGWGVTSDSNKTPYWTVVNSWNPTWGNNGTFLIRRGNDECGFEDDVYAGMPKLQ